MARKKNNASADEGVGGATEEVSASRIRRAISRHPLFAGDVARHVFEDWPLTASGRLKQIRKLQKHKMKLVCEAFASSEPEVIFRYDRLPPELDPKLIRSNLDAFIEWALSEPACSRKDNKIRDETIALMVSAILLNTKLRPTRNRESRGDKCSACSLAVEILGEHGLHVSEALVENAWKRWGKESDAIHAPYRPDLVRKPRPSPK